jgi:PIN domain nuclease of toxin-antitoxin system
LRIVAGILSLSKVLLDASALLALLGAEPGSRKVTENVPGAVIGAVRTIR